MSWSSAQQRRLQVERQILTRYFPDFQWINQTDSLNTKIEGNFHTNSQNSYRLRIYVPSDFPSSRPDMCIISPCPVKGYAGKDLREYEFSGAMHLLSPRDGYARICHYKDWTPELTLYLVILKGRIWLEALDSHRKHGYDIDHYLPHMK